LDKVGVRLLDFMEEALFLGLNVEREVSGMGF
jgi:hypothetical protein